ncbi:MAG: recombinase [Flavobacteriaceae bacterium]|nr:recombinase [Flavobacteriaceae bacterium]
MGFKKNKKYDLPEFFERFFNADERYKNADDPTLALQLLVDLIRPGAVEDPEHKVEALIALLKDHNDYRRHLSAYIADLVKDKQFSTIISDAGIPQASDFFYEVKEKLFAKILPQQPREDNLEYLLNQVFHRAEDARWIDRISENQWMHLFTLLEFKPMYASLESGSALLQLLYSFEILTSRICGKAMQTPIIRMVPEYNNLESPFVAFQFELSAFQQRVLNCENNCISPEDLDFKQLKVLLQQCQEFLKTAYKNSDKYGISLRVNQDLLIIKRQLNRLDKTLDLVVAENDEELVHKSILLAKRLITYNCYKNDLYKFVDEGTYLISYEVVQQTATKGEKYITKDKSGYLKMFKTALGGGLIVGIISLTKVLLYKLEVSDFGNAFIMSMNYSLGFVVLYLLSFTLATKQPAMTASTLIHALESGIKSGGKRKTKHWAFAKFFAQVFRSQFIAFLGNVIMAFPVALILAYLLNLAVGKNLMTYHSETLLTDLNSFQSPLIFHAALAGVYLFLAGIIAGAVDNRNKFNDYYFRIQEHPLLKRTFGKANTKKIAGFFEKKWAGIASNFWFGVFMGSTAAVGAFLGLNLDVRHIAFASGNFALGMLGTDFNIGWGVILWSILGIGIIGLINFGVSFSLSMALAFRSRKIPIHEFRALASSIWSYFKKYPLAFFFPNQDEQVQQK